MTTPSKIKVKEWKKPRTDQIRYYVNNWLDLCDGWVEYYNTGNVRSCAIFSHTTSNNEGSKYLPSKVWYDSTGKVHVDHCHPDYTDKIIGMIQKIINDEKGVMANG